MDKKAKKSTAKKNTVKKNTNKKSISKKSIVKKTKKVNKKIDKKKIIIISICSVAVLLLIMLFIILGSEKNIECTKSYDLNGIREESNLTVNMDSKTISSILVKKTLEVEKRNGIDYISIVRSSLKSAYESLNLDSSILEQDNKLEVEINYNESKEYIIDNVFLAFENDNLSVNVISDDLNNEYLKLDLSKKYSKKNVINLLEEKDYICK